MINLKYQLQHGIKNFSYLVDHILYQIFKIILNILKKHGETVNPSIKIYIKKTKNRTTFKIKTGYYLELLASETIILLGNTKSKTTKNEKGENVPRLEINEVVLTHCNVVNNSYQQIPRTYICS